MAYQNKKPVNHKDILGREMFYVHRGTWENKYEWRIQRVKIRVVKTVEKGRTDVEFGFDCVGYDCPLSYLKNNLDAAQRLAIKLINKEKKEQIDSIRKLKLSDYDTK